MPRYFPYILLCCLILLPWIQGSGQLSSEKKEVTNSLRRAYDLIYTNSEEAIQIARMVNNIADSENWDSVRAQSLHILGSAYLVRSEFDSAFQAHFQAIEIYQELNDLEHKARSLNNLGLVVSKIGDDSTTLALLRQSLELRKDSGSHKFQAYSAISIAEIYTSIGKLDSALIYLEEAKRFSENIDENEDVGKDKVRAAVSLFLGQTFEARGEIDSAYAYYRSSLEWKGEKTDDLIYARASVGAIRTAVFLRLGDDTRHLANLETLIARAESNQWLTILEDSHKLLADIHDKRAEHELALCHFREFYLYHDQIDKQVKAFLASDRKIYTLLKKLEVEERNNDLVRMIAMLFFVVAIILAFIGLMSHTRYLRMKSDRNKFKSGQEEAEAKSHRLQEFTSTISHDIKEPIRSVAFFLELLQRENLIEGKGLMNDLYAEAKEQVDELDHFLRDLEDYFGLSGRKLEMEQVSLAEVVESVKLRLRSRIVETGAQLDVSEMPVVYSQPTLLKMIFQNLISNAIKFQHEGVRPEVDIGANLTREKLSISIKDNGIGIPEQHHAGIFHAFNRGNSYEYPGAGMGLTIVSKAVSILKGTINVYSSQTNGSGTIFVIDLPLIAEPDSPRNEYISAESLAR